MFWFILYCFINIGLFSCVISYLGGFKQYFIKVVGQEPTEQAWHLYPWFKLLAIIVATLIFLPSVVYCWIRERLK